MKKIFAVFSCMLFLAQSIQAKEVSTDARMLVLSNLVNISSDYNGFLNLSAAIFNRKDEISRFKAQISGEELKVKLPKAEVKENGELLIGKDKFSYKNESLYFNDKKIPLLVNGSWDENVQVLRKFFQQPMRSTSSIFMTSAFAGSKLEALVGIGLMFWSLGEKNGAFPFLAGFLLTLRASSASAADGIIPLQVCDVKKGNIFENSSQNIQGVIYTQQYSQDDNGNLILTTRKDKEIEQVVHIKPGSPATVVKTIGANGLTLPKNYPSEFADAAVRNYRDCVDPKARASRRNEIANVIKTLDPSSIQMAQEKLRKMQEAQGVR